MDATLLALAGVVVGGAVGLASTEISARRAFNRQAKQDRRREILDACVAVSTAATTIRHEGRESALLTQLVQGHRKGSVGQLNAMLNVLNAAYDDLHLGVARLRIIGAEVYPFAKTLESKADEFNKTIRTYAGYGSKTVGEPTELVAELEAQVKVLETAVDDFSASIEAALRYGPAHRGASRSHRHPDTEPPPQD